MVFKFRNPYTGFFFEVGYGTEPLRTANAEEESHRTSVSIKFYRSTHIFPGIAETFPNIEILCVIGDSHILLAQSDFDELQHLKKLVVQAYQLKFASGDVFSNLEFLEELKLVGNVEQLPMNLFTRLNKLRVLDLSNQKLTILPRNIFKNNLQLERIELRGNNLKIIDEKFTKLVKLHLLDLNNNVCISKTFEISTKNSIAKAQNIINRNCTENGY